VHLASEYCCVQLQDTRQEVLITTLVRLEVMQQEAEKETPFFFSFLVFTLYLKTFSITLQVIVEIKCEITNQE
jgi:hypothetical protein